MLCGLLRIIFAHYSTFIELIGTIFNYKVWLELQLEKDTDSCCLHLALQAASFALMASLQHLNTCSDRQIDAFPRVCEVLCVCYRAFWS